MIFQDIPKYSNQILLAIPNSLTEVVGHLYCFERVNNEWKKQKEFKVNFGKKGYAWGMGLHKNPENVELKKEGDWKTPLGVFELGKMWSKEFLNLQNGFDYKKVTSKDIFVDRENEFYNQWVVLKEGESISSYESTEKMLRKDHLYDLGIVIKNNPENIYGKGSAIFFHVERAPGRFTAGCTSMKHEDLKELMFWLKKEKHPLLIQIPKSYLNEFSSLKL